MALLTDCLQPGRIYAGFSSAARSPVTTDFVSGNQPSDRAQAKMQTACAWFRSDRRTTQTRALLERLRPRANVITQAINRTTATIHNAWIANPRPPKTSARL